MTTKLTLTIDDKVIDKAKKYAKEQGTSVSDLVENYLQTLTVSARIEKPISEEISKLMGVLSLPHDFDYKKALSEQLSKKYKR